MDESNEPYYVTDDEEELEFDPELVDVELEEDYKEQGQEQRCKDIFLNMYCDDDDESPEEDDAEDSDKDSDGFGSEEEIDDAEGANDLDLGDEGGVKYPIHDPTVKWSRMKPILGERYESPNQLKYCVINYAISNGFNLKFVKNDTVRVVVRCGSKKDKVDCPFRLYASWMTQERSFQVKKLDDKHKCIRKFNNINLMSPSWLARHFMKDLLGKPYLKVKDMQEMIRNKFHCNVSWSKCYRARCRSMSLIEGKLTDHYGKVWDYAQELIRSNPGSTVKVSVTVNSDGKTYFHRIYICFKAIKEGWKRGCRRVIGIDGSFLKGPCKGELLTAIGRCANNQVFPIAWAVVDIENKVNWRWFLDLVNRDLGLDSGRRLTVISDQHKGLVEATKEMLPHVEHRQCARHIYANFYSHISPSNPFLIFTMKFGQPINLRHGFFAVHEVQIPHQSLQPHLTLEPLLSACAAAR